MRFLLMAAVLVLAACNTNNTVAGPLDGKDYIIELTSSQFASGYGNDLVPPLVAALRRSNMKAVHDDQADVVVNIVTDMDVGRWMEVGGEQVWIYTVQITVGISPVAYVIPQDGTPVFGVRVELLTPNPDREDELACLIKLAARSAAANYRPTGMIEIDGQACLR